MEGQNNKLAYAVENNLTDDEIIKQLHVCVLLETDSVDLSNLQLVKKLLLHKNTEIIKLAAQSIAESAKKRENRECLTDPDIIETLLTLLDKSDPLCLTQICRALGNLCYENDKARQFVTTANGLDKMINVIEINVDSSNGQLLNITCGFLLNYLTSNENAQKKALELNILKLVEKIIAKKIDHFATNEDIFTHLLLLLSSLTETMIDNWFSHELCLQIMRILELSMNPEISELCLELLHNQGENDDVKLLLARNGLCELLFTLLEEHRALVQDDEGRALMKLACDLIVLILTGDESMTFLYDNGNGEVYQNMLTWLNSDDVDLLITGVLAIGNFARNDSHCIKMVESGLSETLLGTLSKHNKSNGDIRLQHALLSALRNLVIPAENKIRVVNSGLLEIIYPLLVTEQQPVVFKLLGTLRMVIDGQEETALQLSMKTDLLEKLVEWCFTSDHPGVRAESPRLLSWMIKHCHSTRPFPNMIKVKDCIRCLVEMVPSPHALMQNEAIIALNLLCITCLNDTQQLNKNDESGDMTSNNEDEEDPSFEQVLIKTDIGKFVALLLNKFGDKIEKEVFANLLVLLEYLVQLPNINKHLKDADVSEALRKWMHRDCLKQCTERIILVSSSIDSG